MAKPTPTPPVIRSGARTTNRRGRMTPIKRRELDRLGARWGLLTRTVVDAVSKDGLEQAFGRRAPRLLDIGVGNGLATVAWARSNPGHDVLAVELHQPGLVRLLRDLDAGAATNVRAIEADVTVVIDALEPDTFDQVRVLFPDPWPKRRHRDRRLVEPRFVRKVADLLVVGGTFHMATDHADYADQARGAIDSEGRFSPHPDGPECGPTWRSARPERPVTAYEGRGLAEGRTITDLVALRR